MDGSGGSGLIGRQWTRWLGEFPTKHSVRKIIPRSRTRWENPRLDELGGLGENMRTLGHSSTNSVRFVPYSVLGQICETDSVSFRSLPSHCVRGSLGFKKITEKMRRVPLPYCTVGYWHPTEFKTIRYWDNIFLYLTSDRKPHAVQGNVKIFNVKSIVLYV